MEIVRMCWWGATVTTGMYEVIMSVEWCDNSRSRCSNVLTTRWFSARTWLRQMGTSRWVQRLRVTNSLRFVSEQSVSIVMMWMILDSRLLNHLEYWLLFRYSARGRKLCLMSCWSELVFSSGRYLQSSSAEFKYYFILEMTSAFIWGGSSH